jgi:hypothetical protein
MCQIFLFLKSENEFKFLQGAMKYKHFCELKFSNSCYENIGSRMAKLPNILLIFLGFLNRFFLAKYCITN